MNKADFRKFFFWSLCLWELIMNYEFEKRKERKKSAVANLETITRSKYLIDISRIEETVWLNFLFGLKYFKFPASMIQFDQLLIKTNRS